MAGYIPQTYSNRLSADLQKQAKATAYIEDENGNILYSSDELAITIVQDSVATIQEHSDNRIVTDDDLLSEAIWQTIPLVILGIF